MHLYRVTSLSTPLLLPGDGEIAQSKVLLNNRTVITCMQQGFVSIKGYVWLCIQDFDMFGCVSCSVLN